MRRVVVDLCRYVDFPFRLAVNAQRMLPKEHLPSFPPAATVVDPANPGVVSALVESMLRTRP